MPSCLSGLVRVGGYNTDRVLRDVLSVGVTTQTACYMASCGVGGGYNTDRVLRAVLSVGLVRVGWGYNTDRVLRAVLSVGVG